MNSAFSDRLDPQKVVTVLLLSPRPEDHQYFQHLFDHTNWRLCHAYTLEEALAELERQALPVVVTEEKLGKAGWQEVLCGTQHLPAPPKLIITSSAADTHLWAEVLNLGGYDVLAKPFDDGEVYHTISLAWLAWKLERARNQRQADARSFGAEAYRRVSA